MSNEYTLDVPNPRKQFTEGMDMANLLTQSKLAGQQAQRNATIQSAMSNLGENSSWKDYQKIYNLLPAEQAAQFMEGYKVQTEEKQREALRFGTQVMAALRVDPEMGIKMLQEKAEAFKSSGNEKEAKAADTWARIAKADPEGVANSIGILLAGLPNSKEAIEGISTIGQAARDDDTAEIKKEILKQTLETGKVDIKKSKAETAEIIANIVNMGKTGGLTTSEMFNAEQSLAKQYVRRSGNYFIARSQYQKLLESAKVARGEYRKVQAGEMAEEEGVGDVALIFGFMRMLDPGSVVRESEFARAENTAGVFRRLSILWNKVKSGVLLHEDQREAIVLLAGKYMEAAIRNRDQNMKDISTTVRDYGMNPEHVFGETGSQFKKYYKELVKYKQIPGNVKKVSLGGLNIWDDSNFTKEELILIDEELTPIFTPDIDYDHEQSIIDQMLKFGKSKREAEDEDELDFSKYGK